MKDTFRKCKVCGKEYYYRKIVGGIRQHTGKYYCSKKCMGIDMLEHKNVNWKENVGYISLHEWIKKRKPKPNFCERCEKEVPYDLANISGKYKRDINDFEWLCRRCHMKDDGRMINLERGRRLRCKTNYSFTFIVLIAEMKK